MRYFNKLGWTFTLVLLLN